jgi:hypothetical protein
MSGAYAKLGKATISFVMSVRLSFRMEKHGFHWNYSHEIWCLKFFSKSCTENWSFIKIGQAEGCFKWRPIHIFIISHTFLPRMKNVSDKLCKENQNIHSVFSNFIFENCTVGEIMWKQTVERGRPQITIWCMRFACWITNATKTGPDYLIIIVFDCINGTRNAHQCYGIRTLVALMLLSFGHTV